MMATALAENGASKVYIVGRHEDKLSSAATLHPRYACLHETDLSLVPPLWRRLRLQPTISDNHSIVPLPGDVTSQDSLQAAAERVRQEVGHIDLLVANAGMAGPGLKGLNPRATPADFARSAWSTPMPEFDAVYQLNCTAVYYTILAFLGLLDAGNERRRPGEPRSQVIATSSMVAFHRDPRYGFAYLSSKAALVSMIKSFATYGVAWRIRFNTIAPGRESSHILACLPLTRAVFPSDMSTSALAPFKIDKTKDLSEEGAFARSFLPAERAGSIEDIAGVLLYLASRAGAYVNGSVMLVDGGKIATVPATY